MLFSSLWLIFKMVVSNKLLLLLLLMMFMVGDEDLDVDTWSISIIIYGVACVTVCTWCTYNLISSFLYYYCSFFYEVLFYGCFYFNSLSLMGQIKLPPETGRGAVEQPYRDITLYHDCWPSTRHHIIIRGYIIRAAKLRILTTSPCNKRIFFLYGLFFLCSSSCLSVRDSAYKKIKINS